MKIKYCRKRLATSLIFALAWLGVGILHPQYISREYNHFVISAFIISCLYFANFSYKFFVPYLILSDSKIQKNFPFRSLIHLPDIIKLRDGRNSIILYTHSYTLEISKYKINRHCTSILEDYFQSKFPKSALEIHN